MFLFTPVFSGDTKHARSPLDKSRIYEIEIRGLVASGNLANAIEAGHKALEILDFKMRKRVRLGSITLIIKLLWQTARVAVQGKVNSEPMRDEQPLAAMRILMVLCQAVYMSGGSLRQR